MVSSIVAPVGAVGASGVADDGEWTTDSEGLVSAGLDGADSASTDADEPVSNETESSATETENDTEDRDSGDDVDGTGTASEDSNGVTATATSLDDCTVVEDESIQGAIDDSTVGDTVCVEPGTYDAELTIDVDGLTLKAVDEGETVLTGSSGTGIEIDGASNVTVDGLTIEGYGSRGIGVPDGGDDLTIQNVRVEDSERGIWLANNVASNVLIEDSEIVGNGVRGVHVGENNDNVTIRRSVVSDNGGYGINLRYAPHAAVVDSVIEDNSGTGIAVWDEHSEVRNNTIADNGNVGISVSHDGDYALVEANEITGSETGIRVTANTPDIRDNTVTSAAVDLELDSVRTATVLDNEFETGLALDGSADSFDHFDHEISGNTVDGDPLVFTSGESDPEIPEDAAQVIVVDSSDVEVSGFEFDGVASGVQVAHSPDAVISDNTVTNTASHGIRVWASTGATVSENELVANGETFLVSGIGVHGSSDAVVTNNSIRVGEGRALRVGGSPDAEVRHNLLENNHDGFYLTNSDRAVVTNNTITETHHGETTSNFRAAILVGGSEFVEIRENEITDNHVNGIHDNRNSHSQHVNISDNVISDNGNQGIYWSRSHDATFHNNTVTGNGGDGILGGSRSTVTANDVQGNAQGIDVSHDSLVEGNLVRDGTSHGVEIGDDSVVRDNTILDNDGLGIYLDRYGDHRIDNNTVAGHGTDLRLNNVNDVTVIDNAFETGVVLYSYDVDPDELTTHSFVDNTVADDPLHYVRGESDITVPDDVGQVIVANSTVVDISGVEFDGVVAPVQVAFSDGVTVSDTTVSTNPGGPFNDEAGIVFWATDDVTIEDNSLTDAVIGITVIDGTNARVEGNELVGAEREGLAFTDVDGVELIENVIQETGWAGIAVDLSENVSLTGNTVADGEGDGVVVDRSWNVTAADNAIERNADVGLSIEVYDTGGGADVRDNDLTSNDVGLELGAVSGDLVDVSVVDNRFTENAESGVDVTSDPADVEVTSNAFEGNDEGVKSSAWSPENDLDATDNWWGDETGPSGGETDPETGELADGSGDAVSDGVRFDPWLESDPFEEMPATFEVSDVETNGPVNAGDELDVDVTVTNVGDVTGTQLVSLEDFDGTTVDAVEVVLDAGDDEAVTLTWETTHADVGSGDVTVRTDDDATGVSVTVRTEDGEEPFPCGPITESGHYELTNDLTAGDTCIEIETDDVVLDGMGHTIVGERSGAAIYAGGVENVTVRNMTVANWNHGVEYVDVDGGAVRDVAVIDNRRDGLRLDSSTGIAVTDNDVETVHTGVHLRAGSADNVVENNTVTSSRNWGYMLRDVSGNELSNNTAAESENYGFRVNWGSTENALVGNLATGTGEDGDTGFDVRGDGNELRDNAASGHEREGIRVSGDENLLENNVVSDNDRDGIRVVDGIDNELVANAVTNSGNYGIRMWNAHGNELTDTVVNGSENVDYFTDSESTNNSVSTLTVGEGTDQTTVSFDATGAIHVAGLSSTTELEPPEDVEPIDAYLAVFGTGTEGGDGFEGVDPSIDLDVHYDEEDVELVDESSLAVWSIQDEDEPWTPVDGSAVDTDERIVSASPDASALENGALLGVFAEDGVDFEVSEVALDTDEVVAGESVTVTASVTNVGEVDGNVTVPLSVNGTVVDTVTVEIDAGESAPIEFTHAFDEAGTYSVSVGSTEAGAVDVLAPANVVIFGTSVDETVGLGETLTVDVDLLNDGDVDGEEPLELSVTDSDGEQIGDGPVDSTTANVAAGGITRGESLTWTPTEDVLDGATNATFDLFVNEVFVGEVTVSDEESDIQVIAASASDEEIVAGEDEFHVVGSIYQAGTDAGPETIELVATNTETGNETVLGSQEAELEPGFYHLGAINISATVDTPGTYDLELGDRYAGTVEVEEAYSDVQVVAASASENEIVAGEDEFHVVGSIYQAGTIGGPEEIDLVAIDEDGEETVLGSQEAELAPGFYHLGAINISNTIDTPGTYDLELGERYAGTVEVEEAYSDIDVIAASASESEIVAGEDEFHVVGSIYQAGTTGGPEEIELVANNTETGNEISLDSQEVEISPGFYHLGAINISTTIDEAGTYDLELGDRYAGTIEVEEAYSDVQVIAASASEDEIVAGEDEFYVVGSIYQAGTTGGPEEIELVANNTETGDEISLGTREVELAPGFYHLGAINISNTIDEAGTYDLELGDRYAGTVEVEEAYSDVQVIAASASENEIVAGEDEFHVVGSIYQAGTTGGPEEIELVANNTETDDEISLGTQEVEISPGFYHLGAINISNTIDEAGTYELELGDRYAGTVEVEEAYSDVQVVAASVSEMALTEGEAFYVTGSIYQNGTVDESQEIDLVATNNESGEEIHLGNQSVELEPGFYHLGGLNITTSIEAEGTYDLTLGDHDVGTVGVDESPSDIQVIAATVSDIEVLEGEEANVTGSIYQAGDSGTEEIDFVAIDQNTSEETYLGSQEVTLESGYYHLGAVEIDFQIDEPGSYDLELGGHHAGEILVEEAYSDVQVIAASASEDEIVAGEDEFHVVGSIYQAGTTDGPEEIELVANNTETDDEISLGTREVEIAPGFYHLGAINISNTIDTPGTYDLELGDRYAGTVEVEEAYSDIDVIAASASESEIVAGEDQFHVVGSIYQAGTIGGPEEIELVANNTETDDEISLGTREVEIAPGFYHLGAINISNTIDEAGTYDLELGDRYAGTVEVEEAYSDIDVIAASASESEIVAGEDEFHVVGSIYQAGTTDGPEEIELVAIDEDGAETVLGSQEVEVAPGFYHLGAINISNTIDEAGTYDLELGDRYAGTVEVEEAYSDVQVVAASASENEVVEGVGEFHVVGSIYQAGTIDGPETVDLVASNTATGEEIVLGSQEVEIAPGFYHLGAINISNTIDEAGTYDLELGDRNAGQVTVTDPVVEPTIAGVEGASTGVDADAEVDLVYASDGATVEIGVDADLDLESVTLRVSSQETSYTVLVDATESDRDGLERGEVWSASLPLDELPDDGRYDLSVVAIDERDTLGTHEWDGALVIDRGDPSMSVSIEDVDDEDATVVVESDTPLVEPPTVDASFTEPSTAQVDPIDLVPTDGENTTFEGTLAFDESGEYEVTVTGTDRAGNNNSDTASVVIHTGFTLADGTIEIAETGTSIDFELVDDAAFTEEDLYVALSENAVDANLGGEELGVGFLTADLDGLVEHYLDEGTIEYATIELAVDENALPAGASVDDVGLYHYDDGWSDVDSEIVYDGGDPFVTADVHGFSTYGALVLDEDAPVLTDVSPGDGDELDAGTDEVTVRFEYDDAQSGVDVGSIELAIDGTGVTTDEATSITSSWTEHVLTVEDGESYEAALTLTDEAGNEATFETTFSVAEPVSIPQPPADDDDADDGADESDDDESGDAGDPSDDEDKSAGDDEQSGDDADDGAPPVSDDADQPSERDDEADDGMPGFGPLVAIVALVLALSARFVTRRSRNDRAQTRR